MCCRALLTIADHCCILVEVRLALSRSERCERQYWQYRDADWAEMNCLPANTDWSFIDDGHPDTAAEKMTSIILSAAGQCIPQRSAREEKAAHPWLNDRCFELVAAKQAAKGTSDHAEQVAKCSEGVMQQYFGHVRRTRESLSKLAPSSRKWWRISQSLMNKPER
jgi:hypothetical protein